MRAKTLTLTYKQKNTIIKYFIAVNPQGTISFISNGWGGRASDKFFIEDSQIFGNLSHGDIAKGDCGFNIAKTVEISEFTKVDLLTQKLNEHV